LSQAGERPSFTILRRDGDTIKQVVADETTFAAPDDVIKIPVITPPPGVPSSSSVNLSRADLPERLGLGDRLPVQDARAAPGIIAPLALQRGAVYLLL
jgi:hypothetical protein